MPELPEVETVRRGLNQVTLYQTITGGDVLLDRTIAHPSSIADFLAGLRGTAIAQWHRRGKYLLAELIQLPSLAAPTDPPIPATPLASTVKRENAEFFANVVRDSSSATYRTTVTLPPMTHIAAGYLGVHLRMTGQLLWTTPESILPKHTRVRLLFAGDRELRFVDQRTFGQMWWIPPGTPPDRIMTGLQALGPEPFSTDFTAEYLYQRLHPRQRPIKNALLDQAVVAGVGNIYADEALFLSGIRPQTLCAKISRSRMQQLHSNIVQVLQTSIEAKGTTFSSFRSVEGTNGNYGGIAWVYARDGDPCRTCGTVIERLKLAGRSAHFCPTCQR